MKKYLGLAMAFVFILPQMVTGGTSIFGFGPRLLGSYRSPYSISALGRGGYEMSFIDSLGINQLNYALWTKLERTAISVNFNYNGITTKSGQVHMYNADAGFTGGFITLPLIKQKFVVGLGLTPRYINNTGIKIVDIGPEAGVTQEIQSKGNLSEAIVVGSFSPLPKLALAIDIGYDFGMITDATSILYENAVYGDIYIQDEYQLRGLNYGMNGFYEYNEKYSLGFKFKSPTPLTMHQERKSSNLPESIKQTIDIVIPSLFGLGLGYRISPLWHTGLDCIYQNWQRQYTVDEEKIEQIRDSYRIGLGFEKSPVEKRFLPFLQNLSWRGGVFFSQLNVTVNDNPVYEYGLTAGLSIPIWKHRNRIDLAFEFGQRGDAKSTLLREQFFGISFSLSSSEQWFVREKR